MKKRISNIGAAQGNKTVMIEKRSRQGKTNTQWAWTLLAAPVLEVRMNPERVFLGEGSRGEANQQGVWWVR